MHKRVKFYFKSPDTTTNQLVDDTNTDDVD